MDVWRNFLAFGGPLASSFVDAILITAIIQLPVPTVSRCMGPPSSYPRILLATRPCDTGTELGGDPDWCFLFAQIHNKVHSLRSSHFRERQSKEKEREKKRARGKNREVGGEGKRVHATAKQIHWVWRKQMLWKMKLGLPILNPQASIWWWSGSSGGRGQLPPLPPR